jgi:hypothetical protein
MPPAPHSKLQRPIRVSHPVARKCPSPPTILSPSLHQLVHANSSFERPGETRPPQLRAEDPCIYDPTHATKKLQLPLGQYTTFSADGVRPRHPISQSESVGMPRFVGQEHFARTHNFDFHLEKDGVFNSWAVPKGIPDQPGVKRLALQVDDQELGDRAGVGDFGDGDFGAGHRQHDSEAPGRHG